MISPITLWNVPRHLFVNAVKVPDASISTLHGYFSDALIRFLQHLLSFLNSFAIDIFRQTVA